MFDWTFDVESERLISMSVSLPIDFPLFSEVTESVLTEVLVLVLEFNFRFLVLCCFTELTPCYVFSAMVSLCILASEFDVFID